MCPSVDVLVKQDAGPFNTFVLVRVNLPEEVKVDGVMLTGADQPASAWFPLYRVGSSKKFRNSLPGQGGRLQVRVSLIPQQE